MDAKLPRSPRLRINPRLPWDFVSFGEISAWFRDPGLGSLHLSWVRGNVVEPVMARSGADFEIAIRRALVGAAVAMGLGGMAPALAVDALPSWNDSPSKAAILEFVAKVATEGSPDFVPPPARIAVFDNDGTLWVEQPVPAQVAFELDCVDTVADEHPDWATTQPFKAALEKDIESLASGGEKRFSEIMVATHAGWTVDDYDFTLTGWLRTTSHVRFKQPYTKLTYQPMLELVGYMRDNGFQIYIVSGNSADFMRPWVEEVYGVPRDRVIGSSIRTALEMKDGRPVLVRVPEIDFIGEGADRAAGIREQIGRRPIAAFGNSDSDLEMLLWTTAASGVRLGVIVHHTDAAREYAYDRDASFGRLDKALDAAAENGWIVIDMKEDWKVVFPFELD
jgi:hypothetical protein